MTVAASAIVRYLGFLVGAFVIGCAAPAAKRVETTPVARLQWLRAEFAQSELMNQYTRGAYLPRAVPGSAMVCTLAIEIHAWYGFNDERWELTNAGVEDPADDEDLLPWMPPVSASSTMREEMARIGIRDCILDMNR